MIIHDVGIVGLGAMGSMTALELVRRGKGVIGFDRFRPPHSFGSSTGRSRIIREAYFEHPQYVPLVQRAYVKWAELERDGQVPLLSSTGGLMIGPPEGILVAGAHRSAELHGLPFEMLTATDVRRRFPVFLARPHEVGLYEPRAGVLRPEAAIETALALAASAGAVFRYEEPVLEWRPAAEAILVRTEAGEYRVRRLILAAGAWMAGALPGYPLGLTVARQALFWFEPAGDRALVSAERMPIFIWEWAPGEMFYGFPDQGAGVKVAIHHQGEPADPDTVRRTVALEEAGRLREIMAELTPAFNGRLLESAVCLYTNTRDGDFLIDRSPADSRVILASPCSGHGFKFAPALGEVLADLAEDRRAVLDITPFRLRR